MTTCRVCAMPLDPVHADDGSHPTREPGGVLPTHLRDHLIAALARAVGACPITEETAA